MRPIDPYKAKRAIEGTSSELTRRLAATRYTVQEAQEDYDASDGNLDALQALRYAEGVKDGISEARDLLDRQIELANRRQPA